MPRWRRTRAIVSTSRTAGTFLRTIGPSTRRAAAISGRTAFLAPLTLTRPFKRHGPWMRILSMAGRIICDASGEGPLQIGEEGPCGSGAVSCVEGERPLEELLPDPGSAGQM